MKTIRLTMAQALIKFLQNQRIATQNNQTETLFAGCWAIFGHGNVAGLGEALEQVQGTFPTFRAHNEQGMALAAIAFAKQHRRCRMMACTSSIGPGASNMVTAAALAFVNRLPVLLLPGDTFAARTSDPVLQQIEHFGDPTITVNDCFRPVSRYFDRINRPEQLLTALPAALRVLLDPAECGPATICLPQDVQTMAFDYPSSFFEAMTHQIIRPGIDPHQLGVACDLIRKSSKPVIIVGGGVHYSLATQTLQHFVEKLNIPAAETQAGKGALRFNHPNQLGAIGVTGSSSANHAVLNADLIIAIGTRLQDFTTASRTLFNKPILNINVNSFDSFKHNSYSLQTDAKQALLSLQTALQDWQATEKWLHDGQADYQNWQQTVCQLTAQPKDDNKGYLPNDAEVIGAVQRNSDEHTTVVCAAGGLPAELHKLWQAHHHLGYHLEYGYSCMGYEIAGGLGVKMATPAREVIVMVGDGSYLMLNSEIATAVMSGHKITIVVLNNRGFACINRLQISCGSSSFNNLWKDSPAYQKAMQKSTKQIDFAAHAQSLGAEAKPVQTIAQLEKALQTARKSKNTFVIVIDTDPTNATEQGGAWWDVAVAEVSSRDEVQQARKKYQTAKQKQLMGNNDG